MNAVLMTADAGSFSGLLEIASSMFQWFITNMSTLVTFIVGNPIVLAGFMILMSGAVVGMFMRIWKSA